MKLVDHIAFSQGISKKKAKLILDSRRVFVNKRRVWMAGHEIQSGDSVEIIDAQKKPDNVRIEILHQDKDLIIIDKPAGILSTGPGSVEEKLSHQLGKAVLAVHRLDTDTSGTMILAFNEKTRDLMKEIFRKKKVTKIYHALSAGRFSSGPLVINSPLEGKPAVTKISPLKTGDKVSLLEITIETGRTHQIRKHLAEKHIRLLGEKEYDRQPVRKEFLRKVPRQMLHATRIIFSHPVTGKKIEICVEPPEDFQKLQILAGLKVKGG